MTWEERLSVAISSRNRVPPSADRILPALSATAPVNAPFRWPKSSLSISASGSAPQLTATSGRSFLELLKWMARATISFPLPVSPLMSTLDSAAAAFAMKR